MNSERIFKEPAPYPMALNINFWLRISIVNLLIVALFGTLMRYKIGFEFPYLNQKHLQLGHSHFAFLGWITHTLYVCMVGVLQKDQRVFNAGIYRKLIVSNLVCAYGMLVSFTVQGYGAVSIAFSSASILISYLFTFFFLRDLKGLSVKPYFLWFKAALAFNVISSIGTFILAYMMATHNVNNKIHLASLYYYLHFQYNGFFTFACIGLFLDRLDSVKLQNSGTRSVFWMFFLSCIPAYFLSVLWIKLPVWLLLLVAASALVQLWAWMSLLIKVRNKLNVRESFFKSGRYLLVIVAIALTVKFLLQSGSTIPEVSKLAFGFRAIIIAYLHLVLLAIISVFLIAYAYFYRLIHVNRLTTISVAIFVTGVYLNEIVLGLQGIASFSYTPIPFINEILFFVSVLILIGISLLVVSQRGAKLVAKPQVIKRKEKEVAV